MKINSSFFIFRSSFRIIYYPVNRTFDFAILHNILQYKEGKFYMGNAIEDKPLVLIAEDDASNYLLLEILLKETYRLIHALNGYEVISLFQQYHPQLILMDIKMPEMDGYTATAEIRKISQEIPIIAVTAYAFTSDEERILSNGFNAYISKPIESIKLKEVIAHFLN